jgi:hypothetical protein
VGDMPSPGCVRERAWTAYDMHVDADSCSGCVRVRVRACVCALESGSEGGRRAQEGGRSSRPTKQIPRSVRVDAICFCKRLAASTVKRASNPKFKWRSVESENKAANLALSAMADRPCRPRNNTCRGHCQQPQWERSADASDTFTARRPRRDAVLTLVGKKKGASLGDGMITIHGRTCGFRRRAASTISAEVTVSLCRLRELNPVCFRSITGQHSLQRRFGNVQIVRSHAGSASCATDQCFVQTRSALPTNVKNVPQAG